MGSSSPSFGGENLSVKTSKCNKLHVTCCMSLKSALVSMLDSTVMVLTTASSKFRGGSNPKMINCLCYIQSINGKRARRRSKTVF